LSPAHGFVTIPPATTRPQAAQAAAKADIQDLVFRSDAGLYKVRLHVAVNGKSASTAWGSFLDKAIAYADRNRDGNLSPEALAKTPPPFAYLQGINYIFNGGQPPVRFADLDTNKDGKISREEFARYFRNSGLGAVQVTVQPPSNTAE